MPTSISPFAWGLFATMVACYVAIGLWREERAKDFLDRAIAAVVNGVRPRAEVLLVAGAIFLLRLLVGWSVSGPYMAADELGYLGAAQFLSGTGPMYNLASAAFYPAGYSVLLVPAFLLFKDPVHVYRAVAAIDAVLGALQLVVTYALVRRVVGAGRRTALIASFLAAIFPAYLLNISIAWSENALPLFVGILVLCGDRLTRPGARWFHALAFGATASYLWFIHGRALLVPLVAVLFLAAIGLRRRVPVTTWACGLFATVAVWFLAQHLNHLVFVAGYANPDSSYGQQAKSAISSGLHYLRAHPFAFLVELLRSYAGVGWYLVESTCGVAVIGVWWLVLSALGRTKGASQGAALLALGVCAAIFVVSAGIPAGTFDPPRADHAIYGRYNESMLWLPLAFGAAVAIDRSGRERARWLWLAPVAVLASTIFVALAVPHEVWSRGFNVPCVWAFAAWLALPGLRPPATAVWVASTVSLLIALVVAWKRATPAVAAGLLVLLFSSETALAFDAFVRNDNGRVGRAEYESLRAALPTASGPLEFNWDDYDIPAFYVLQFWLRPQRYTRYSRDRGERPAGSAVVSVSCPTTSPDCTDHFEPHPIAQSEHQLWIRRAEETIIEPQRQSKLGFYSDGVWTNGDARLLGVNVCSPGEYRFLTVSTYGYRLGIAGAPPLDLRVSVGNRPLTMVGRKDRDFFFELPLTVGRIDAISIRTSVVVPAERGVNADSRRLGLDIQAIRLTRRL